MEIRAEYEFRSLLEARQRFRETEQASLSDRKEAQAAFFAAMADDPARVGERVGWLLSGDYGYGEKLLAERVIEAGSRTNKRAQLTHLIGAFEWRCPPPMVVQAWKKLTKRQQADLDAVLDVVIAEAKKEDRDE